MRFQNSFFLLYLIYIGMAGFCRLFLLKRVYTLYICMFFSITVNSQEIYFDSLIPIYHDTNYSLQKEYEQFKLEMMATDSLIATKSWDVLNIDCEKFKLEWINTIRNNHLILEKANYEMDLCSQLNEIREMKELVSNGGSIYGYWECNFEYSKNYVCISGGLVVASEVYVFMLFKRKE